VLLDANHVALFNAGAAYRVRHPARRGDAATVIELRHDVLLDVLAQRDPSAADRPDRPFERSHAAVDSAAFALQCALAEALADPAAVDALEVEETALRLVAAAGRAAAAHPARAGSSPGRRRGTRRTDRGRVLRSPRGRGRGSFLSRGSCRAS
jgi:hypothetical protein